MLKAIDSGRIKKLPFYKIQVSKLTTMEVRKN